MIFFNKLGTNIDKNLIIIAIDGGICSQISLYALGKLFENMGGGDYKIKFDISWFKEFGTDMDGIFARNFDMNKCFPNLNLEVATEQECKEFRKKYMKKENQTLSNCIPPLYIANYYPKERLDYVVKIRKLLRENFVFPDKTQEQQDLLNQIKTHNSCGIHIRRGDIATSNCYGKPADKYYFLEAINIINKTNTAIEFYFFSDEPNWVKENIIQDLKDINYKICDKNGSDKGYLDLYLLSQCKHIISSNGSLGIFGKILADNQTKLWMCKYWDFICRSLDNVYIINRPETNTAEWV